MLDQVVEDEKRGKRPEEKTRGPTEECPICLDTIKLGLMTPCGHSFCGDCILEVYRKGKEFARISCPYCRQKVSHDMKLYLSEEEWNTKEPEELELRSKIIEDLWIYKVHVNPPYGLK